MTGHLPVPNQGGAPEAVEVRAPAKLNLHLRVLARRTSGYHSLETVFCAVDLYDELRVERIAQVRSVELTSKGCEEVAPHENLAYRAASAYLERLGAGAVADGVRIRLSKGIPAGAGLGGGSADAAFVLRSLEVLFGGRLGLQALLDLAAELGSDVPFFLAPQPFALAWGRGERLLPLPAPPPAPLVLALPSVVIPTGWAFGALAERQGWGAGGREAPEWGAGQLLPPALMAGKWSAFTDPSGSRRGAFPVNDFEAVVFREHPELARIREAMEAAGAQPARLTGSGAALFGRFTGREEAEEVARQLGEAFPECRFVPTRTLRTFPEPTPHRL